MSQQLTIDDARQSLTSHVEQKGLEIREKYGPRIGWKELQLILQDKACVRYPCEIIFDAAHLQAEEFAFPMARGANPEDGFTLYVHPYFSLQPERIPYLVLYYLVVVNYGEFASSDDAETFGAAVLGLSRDVYYNGLCEMMDEISGN